MSTKPEARTPQEISNIAGWKGAAPNSDDAFTFVVVSDRTGAQVEGEWDSAVREVNLLKPDFVICVGDLIEGMTEDNAEITRQWEEFESITEKFDAPFFYCAGNHDVSNDVMWKIYVERHGVDSRSYYSFGYRGCHFVVLDSHTALQKTAFAEEQFAWLTEDLAAAKDTAHVFVFYEIPRLCYLWEDTREDTNLLTGTHWTRLRALLPAEKTTIFNGHWHGLTFHLVDGIPTYILAATGGQVDSCIYEIDGEMFTMKPPSVLADTGAAVGRGGRALGAFRMFAHVAVDQGKPTIALVPLHEILPGSYAEFVTNARKVFSKCVHPLFVRKGV